MSDGFRVKVETDKNEEHRNNDTNCGKKLNFTLEASTEKEYDIFLMTGNKSDEGGD